MQDQGNNAGRKKSQHAFIQEASDDHNFDFNIDQSPGEFVRGVREAGGYYVPATKWISETSEHPGHKKVFGVVFVPWHRIDFFRFEEVADGK